MARKKAGKRADGEGTLRQRSDGRWESRITIGTDPATGKPIHKYFSGKGQQEVKKKRDEYLTKVATGTYIEPDKKTFGDWLGRYLTAFVKPKVKASTYSNYADLYKKHINPSIGEVPLQKLDTDTLQTFYNFQTKHGRLDYITLWELPKDFDWASITGRKGTKLEPTIEWLKVFLAEGPKQESEIKHKAESEGATTSTLRNARGKLNIVRVKKPIESKKAGGLSPRIIHMMHQIINGSLKQAVRQKVILFNPAEATIRPSLKHKEINPLSIEEINQYLAVAKDDRLYAAFLLEFSTGLRRGELLALSWDCVDLGKDKGTITVKRTLARVKDADTGISELQFSEPKTESAKRTIPLTPELVKELKKHKARQAEEILSGVYDKESNLVFTTEFGTPLEPRNFYRKHSRILEKANLRHVRFHDLRHSFATVLLQAGENPENLRDLLGHSKTSTTMDIYSHSTVEGKERAISRLSQIIQA